MDHRRAYDSLVKSAYGRHRRSGLERHHIIPRCIGGDNSPSNIVIFTPREHYLAHMLLAKMYPEVHGLKLAVILMSSRCKARKSKAYEAIRISAMAQRTERLKGKPRPREHMEAMWRSNTGVPLSEERRKAISIRNKGMKLSPESRAKISEKARGRKLSQQWITNAAKGQASLSDETVQAMRRAYDAGGVQDHISISHGVSKSLGSRIMKRKSYKWVPEVA